MSTGKKIFLFVFFPYLDLILFTQYLFVLFASSFLSFIICILSNVSLSLCFHFLCIFSHFLCFLLLVLYTYTHTHPFSPVPIFLIFFLFLLYICVHMLACMCVSVCVLNVYVHIHMHMGEIRMGKKVA